MIQAIADTPGIAAPAGTPGAKAIGQPVCSCLINSYNYERFVLAAVESARSQTRPFDEIIIVDDGSNDRSLRLLRRHFEADPRIRILSKRNGGQLSCFNTAFTASRGELLFFLDADDLFQPNYLAQALAVYQRYPHCGLLFTDYTIFGRQSKRVRWGTATQLLGYSLIETLSSRHWVGAPTSCLSGRRTTLQKILPLPLEEDWRTRADDCLIYGADLVGARKGYLDQPLVGYRSHGNNRFCNRQPDNSTAFEHGLAVCRLFDWFIRQQRLNFDLLAEIAHREFCTHDRPSFRLCKRYSRSAWRARLPLAKRLKIIKKIHRHYWTSAFGCWRRSTGPDVVDMSQNTAVAGVQAR